MPEPGDIDTKVVGKAFTVEINGRFLPAKTFSGGQKQAEKTEATSGSTQQEEATVGHNQVSELVIESYIVPGDKGRILTGIYNEVAVQKQQRRYQITIVELAKDNVTPVKRFEYDGCLFTGLDFPRISAQAGETLTETATFKPQVVMVKRG